MLTLFFFGPFFWTLSSSLKVPSEITTYPPVFIPGRLHFENYYRAWTKVPFFTMGFASFAIPGTELFLNVPTFGGFYVNSLIVTVLAVTGQVLSACLVAYGFARFQFPFRNTLFMLVIATLIVPWEVTIIPSFLLYKWLGWLDTLKPLIVPSWFGGSPLYIFLLRQFFMGIPRDLDEAAEMDGANSFRVLWQILVPLCMPALTTVAIFSFLQHWNEFIQPLIFLNTDDELHGVARAAAVPDLAGRSRRAEGAPDDGGGGHRLDPVHLAVLRGAALLRARHRDVRHQRVARPAGEGVGGACPAGPWTEVHV